MNAEPRIVSFVLRFVYEEQEGDSATKSGDWYSVIRHVQSDSEQRFANWQEIVGFLSNYVDLNKEAKDV